MKKKSSTSKKGSYVSSVNRGGAYADEATLELMRISLKKEGDRNGRLEKLLRKYQSIRAAEKDHIRAIKASIIELKDIQAVAKIRFLVDPNIYVDNNLSIETRQFLCMLLNTFYKRYEENEDYQRRSIAISDDIRQMIKSVSYNEEMLFRTQKLSINQQVQMESQLLREKNKIKEENQKIREAEVEEKRVRLIWAGHKSKHDQHKEKIESLRRYVCELESKITSLDERINYGERIRQGNQQKMTGQLNYQMKFQEEVFLLKDQIDLEYSREKRLKQKVMQKRMKIDRMKRFVNIDKEKHEIMMKFLELDHPGPSQACRAGRHTINLERSLGNTSSNIVS